MNIDSGYINEALFLKHLQAQMNQQMLAAAEPLIQQALKDVEAAMRKRLAEHLVGLIGTSFSMERNGKFLRIELNTDPRNGA